ncbi:MAG: gliding motility-associated C-terminal domain-containing protein [Chitinophaga sp.]|uniref:Ig-like domain-containing protein n=1 Tax=Chitinophaga sp. TaxID=1869181 RepID=UPI0025B8EB82|nr:Ig-like domain-containing protein [Chitinophaga sp.]MBV8255973.1 gliding motility-associated C-terminal domain-containing protein [Chitinophaga sp.]
MKQFYSRSCKRLLLVLGMLCSFLYVSAQFRTTNITKGNVASPAKGDFNTAVAADNAGFLYTILAHDASTFDLVKFPLANPAAKVVLATGLVSDVNILPGSIQVASTGDIFFINANAAVGYEIRHLVPAGGGSYINGPTISGNYYSALALDQFNNLYAVQADAIGGKMVIARYPGYANAPQYIYTGNVLKFPPVGSSYAPSGLVIDITNTFYVTGYLDNDDKLVKIAPPYMDGSIGSVTVIAQNRGFVNLALDPNNNLLSTEGLAPNTSHIVKYTTPVSAGASGIEVFSPLTGMLGFFPMGVVGLAGNSIYAADYGYVDPSNGAAVGRIVSYLGPTNATVTGVNNSQPTNAGTVTFKVVVDQDVSGASASDFGVYTTGSITGAAIASVTQTDARTIMVTVNTGTGNGTIDLKLLDVGNISRSFVGAPKNANTPFTIDKTPPAASFLINGGAGFTNNPVLNLSMTLDDAVLMAYSTDGTTFLPDITAATTGTFTVPNPDGLKTLYVRFKDAAGNYIIKSQQITLDRVAPVTSLISNPPSYTNSTSATFNLQANKPGSTFYSLDGGANAVIPSNPFTLSGLSESSHTISYYSVDQAGNVETTKTYTWVVDLTPPTVATVTPPPNTTYNSTTRKTIIYKVTFSENVNVVVAGGIPSIGIVIGGVNKTATYTTGGGTNTLTFVYNVVSGDNDASGITTAGAITLNGGFIMDMAGNNAVLTFTPPVTPGVFVNTKIPTCTISAPNPVYGPYTLTITFSEIVTGMSTAAIQVGNGTVSNLQKIDNVTYTCTVTPQADGNVPMVILANKVQNTGSYYNLSSGVVITYYDKTPPAVTGLTPPAAGTYKLGDVLNFSVTYDKPIAVTGTPTLDVVLSSGTVSAQYQSMSGNTLNFAYVVANGDLEPNNIGVGPTINLNGGTIIGTNTQNAGLTLSAVPANNGVKVDGVVPVITTVTGPANGTYNATTRNQLTFTVTYNKNVIVTGTPFIGFVIGSASKNATYVSGSGTNTLTFNYTVQPGDNDASGIATASTITLNGGTLQDAVTNTAMRSFTAPNTSGVFVNTNTPTCIITAPGTTVYGDFTATITFSEAVTGLTAASITATNATVSNLQTTDNITYTCTVSPQNDGNVTLNVPAGAAQNTGSYNNTASNTLTLYYDKTPPAVTALTLPTPKYYKLGDVLNFSVKYDKPIVVTGTPTLDVVLSSGTVSAQYQSISGNTLSFTYTVANGDLAPNNIGIGAAIHLNGATIIGANTQNAVLNLPAVAPNNGVKVDGVPPTVSTVVAPANGYYNTTTNKVLTYTVNFSEPVTVTGTPTLDVTIGTTVRKASYTAGSGTSALTFTYNIQTGDNDADGISTGVISLNGGTIQDVATNNAVLTFTAPNTTGVMVNTNIPTCTLSTAAPTVYGNFTLTITFSEPVTGLTAAAITATNATVSNLQTSDNITYTCTVSPQNEGNATLTVPANAAQNTGGYGNTASAPLTVYYDKMPPVVTGVTLPALNYYKLGAVLNFSVTYDKLVTVTGTPTLDIILSSGTVKAQYQGMVGRQLNFAYTVANGDLERNNIAMGTAINLNGGSIIGLSTRNADLNLPPIPANNGVKVDGTIPVVTSVDVPADGYYNSTTNKTLNFTVNFSEDISFVGSPILDITIGGVTRHLFVSHSSNNNITFSYQVVNGDQDLHGISINGLSITGGSINDIAGNPANLTLHNVASTANVFVSTANPTVTITAPALVTGPFTTSFTFSEKVTGFTAATINTGGMATVSNVQTTDNITYTATMTPTTEGLMTVAIAANAVQSLGLNGNQAGSAQVRYSAIPVVQQTNVPGNGFYTTGQPMGFMVTYQKPVIVNTTNGTPSLQVIIGTKTVNATYLKTAGNNVIFQYMVVTGDQALSGIQLGSMIQLNGATMKDGFGVDADLTLNNIPATNNVLVYTTVPSATITGPAKTNQPFTITVAFNEAVTGLTTSSFAVTNATPSNLQAGANNTYTALVTPMATGNVTVQLPAGIVKNIANIGNTASNVLTTAYDGTAPVINSVTVPANGYYNASQTLTFNVVFSKPVTVTGSPVLPLTIGTKTVSASYVSGSGTNTLTFSYAVQAGDMDMDGIDLSTALNLNGGTIADDFSNNAVLSLAGVPSTTQVRVNTAHPSVTLSGNTARVNTPVNVTAVFSEAVTGLTAANFTVTNGSVGSLATTDNITYTFVITPAADGQVSVSLPANAVMNIGNNSNTASNTFSFVYDATPPVVTIPTMDVSGDVPLGALVGKLTATDALGTIQNWTIVADASNGAFALDANGNVTVKNIPALKLLANSNTSITITVSDGVNTTAPIVVNIHVGPLFVNKAPTMDPIADQTICADYNTHSIQLTGLSAVETDQTYTLRLAADAAIFDQLNVSQAGVVTYKFKSTLTSGDANITVTIQDNGGTANNGVDTFKRTFHLRVNAMPVVNITADKSNPVSKGDIIHLTATGGDLFSWDPVDGIVSGQQSNILVARVKADATYKVTVSNVTGCTNSGTYAVTANNDFKVDATNLLTPNGDGINDKWVIKNIDLYTNNEVKIFDRSGRLVYQRRNYNNEWDATLNGHALSEGTYYYILTIDGGAKTAKGFITIVREQR